ncbi:MAG: hypothetical protein HYX92_04775 [Chloroflexi bacterium]|nr:hypothetical protein [Chloroflexota bacterium]
MLTLVVAFAAALATAVWGIAGYASQEAGSRGRVARLTLIAALIAALTTAAGGVVVYASQDTLPSDSLYPIKVAGEDLQLALAFSDLDKAQTYLELAAKRLEEIQRASLAARDPDVIGAAAASLVADLAEAEQHLGRAAASGEDTGRVTGRLAENLARQQRALSVAAERAPEPAKAAVVRALARVQKGLTVVGVTGDGAPSTLPAGQPGAASALASNMERDLNRLMSDVEKLATDANVPGQSFNGLLAKLSAAITALARGEDKVALDNLDAFLNELNALQRSGHISARNFDALHAGYSSLVVSLGGAPVAVGASSPDDDRGRNRGPSGPTATREPGEDDRGRNRGPGGPDATRTPEPGDDSGRGRGPGGPDPIRTPEPGDDSGRNRGPGGPDATRTPEPGDDSGRNRGPGGPDGTRTPEPGDDSGRNRGPGGPDAQAPPEPGDDRGRGRGRDDTPTPAAGPPGPTAGPSAPPQSGGDDRGRGRGGDDGGRGDSNGGRGRDR